MKTVANFFAQYAETGHVFPAPGLEVVLKDGDTEHVVLVIPSAYGFDHPVVRDYDGELLPVWKIDGTHEEEYFWNIVAIPSEGIDERENNDD